MVAQLNRPTDKTQVALIPVESDRIPPPQLIRKYSKAAVGRMCNPPVTNPTAVKYHKLALAYLPIYRQAFEYQWGDQIKVDESADIPETHIPVIQLLRQEYIPVGEHRPTDTYVQEWLAHPDTQCELSALIDPMLALLYCRKTCCTWVGLESCIV